ncbi:hypothetical protein NB706_002837 [Xanthomonas sacchari]|nr:hypothetical protein [Xanthomonas sacchari]
MLGAGEVVGAEVDHHPARRQTVDLALAQPPQHVLGAVPAEAQVQHPRVAEGAVPGLRAIHPDRLRRARPEMGDRVAEHHHLRLQLPRGVQRGMVAAVPVVGILLQPGHRDARGVDVGHRVQRHPRRLIDQARQGRLDGLGHAPLPTRVRMQRATAGTLPRIVEQARVQRAVDALEHGADVQVGHTRIVAVAHRQCAIDLGIACALLRRKRTGQQAQQQDARVRQALLQRGDHRIDPAHRVRRALPLVAGVVGADQQQRDLGPQAVDLAVLQAPQHVFGGVAAEAEVERAAAAVEGLPGRLEVFVRCLRLLVVLGDRIADQQQRRLRVRASLRQHLLVALGPPGLMQAVGRGHRHRRGRRRRRGLRMVRVRTKT